MLSSGGRTSTTDRSDVDLYVRTEDVDGLYQQLKDRVEIREGLNNTFYGTREFIIRDANGFWITRRTLAERATFRESWQVLPPALAAVTTTGASSSGSTLLSTFYFLLFTFYLRASPSASSHGAARRRRARIRSVRTEKRTPGLRLPAPTNPRRRCCASSAP